MNGPRVVLLEDDPKQRDLIASFLRSEGFEVIEADSVASGKETVASARPDCLLTDFNLPDGDGLEVLRYARSMDHEVGAIVLSAYGTVAMAVDAMRSGAFDVMLKPVEPGMLVRVVRRSVEHRRLKQENASLRRVIGAPEQVGGIIGSSGVMSRVLADAQKLAKADATLLITGESGTGKELIARMMHQQSDRGEEPMVAVNCAAVPPGLMESEFFGHVRGAFTGAVDDHAGHFEAAGAGTVFLDEIGELPPPLQGRLLRVLQEREVVRVGESTPRPVHARMITATNRDLEAEVRGGRFRADLYHRVNALRLHLPPLRARGSDVRDLATHFAAQACARAGRPPVRISREVYEALEAYAFPGNVRELRNVIEHAMLLATDDTLRAADLPATVLAPHEVDIAVKPASLDLNRAVAALERRLIKAALDSCDGVQTKAAELLGIDERVLRYRRKKLGIGREGD